MVSDETQTSCLPSTKWAKAFFSEVASPCKSTIIAFTVLPRNSEDNLFLIEKNPTMSFVEVSPSTVIELKDFSTASFNNLFKIYSMCQLIYLDTDTTKDVDSVAAPSVAKQ